QEPLCLSGPSRHLKSKENKGFRIQQRWPLTAVYLGCRFEVQRKHSSNRSGMGVERVGFEPPLPDRIGCGTGKGQPTLPELGILHGAIAANQQLQNNCSM